MSPATPSGAKPPQIKEEIKKIHRKPGAKKGHKGTSRKKPDDDQVDRTEKHTIDVCPDCGNSLSHATPVTRSRIIIDIDIPAKPETVKHEIDRCWCSVCRKYQEPVVDAALPGFSIGLRTVVYSAFLHYSQGLSISKVVKNLSLHGMKLSSGELIGAWGALADLMRPHYDQIHDTIRNTKSALYADETGHRQKGQRFWLWVFATKNEALFLIRRKRNGAVVLEVLGKTFDGILVTDFWKPYLATIARLRQWCVAHLLREFKKIEFRESKPPPEYFAFKKKTVRLFRDALRFSKGKNNRMQRARAKERFLRRLSNIIAEAGSWPDIQRLARRLKNYHEGLFTFVSHPGVDATNNHGERSIRFAVIHRKVQFHTMSDRGSFTMETLLTVFRTLEMRGKDPYSDFLDLARQEIRNSKQIQYKSCSAA
jgi:hypothetical protein